MTPLKKEPKFKMNTCFYSNVLWLHLGYKISTLKGGGLDTVFQKDVFLGIFVIF